MIHLPRLQKLAGQLTESAVEYDGKATAVEAAKLEAAIKKQFHVEVSVKSNSDGSCTFTVNNGHMSDTARGVNDPNVLTPQTLSKVIDPWWTTFRSKGWTFTQPTRGEFTIGVK